MALTVYLDGRRVLDMPPVIEAMIELVLRHRDDVLRCPHGSVVADYKPGRVQVSVVPGKIILAQENIRA